jgi:hypothetical protein
VEEFNRCGAQRIVPVHSVPVGLGLKPRRRLISLLSLSSRVSKPAPEDSPPRVCFAREQIAPIPR